MEEQDKNKRASLRDVPSIDALLRTGAASELRDLVGPRRLTGIAGAVTAEIRVLVRNQELVI